MSAISSRKNAGVLGGEKIARKLTGLIIYSVRSSKLKAISV